MRQTLRRVPVPRHGARLEFKGDAMQADPGLKAPGFQKFDCEKDTTALNLNLVSELAPLHQGDAMHVRVPPQKLQVNNRAQPERRRLQGPG